jgi:hypothetical protein
MNSSQLKQAWENAVRLKTPAERRTALEVFLDLPFEILLKFSKKNRKPMQRRMGPMQLGEGRSFIFSASRIKNVLKDAVHIYARRSRNRIYAEQILVCDEIIVARIPNDRYWVRQIVRAAAGSHGGARIVNVYEFIGGCYPDLNEEVKEELPNLKSYKFRGSVIRCAWSTRDLGLQLLMRHLHNSDGDELAAALQEFDTAIRRMDVSEEVRSKCREKLKLSISKLLASPHSATQLWANRVWMALLE